MKTKAHLISTKHKQVSETCSVAVEINHTLSHISLSTTSIWIILLTFLYLGTSRDLFAFRSFTKILCRVFIFPHTTSPIHFQCLYLIIITILGKEYNFRSSLQCHFLYTPVTSRILGSNILTSTSFLLLQHPLKWELLHTEADKRIYKQIKCL